MTDAGTLREDRPLDALEHASAPDLLAKFDPLATRSSKTDRGPRATRKHGVTAVREAVQAH